MRDKAADDTRPSPPARAPTGSSVLPLISICLLALGGALLIQQVWLDMDWLVGAAVGLLRASALAVALYVSTLLTLLYIPVLAVVAFSLLVIGGRQAVAGHGHAWQLWLGAAFLVLFGLTVVSPSEGKVVVPVVLIAIGAAIAAGTAPPPEPERSAERGY